MGTDSLKIVDIDYWENDAILVKDGKRHYFQFSGSEPTLSEALQWVEREERRKRKNG